jgi:transcriptional regulator with XRE-family HTH domain
MSDFGQRVRDLRKERGLTQRDLAARIGLDFTYLSKIETGALPPPSEAAIARIADQLATSNDELLALARKVPSDLARTLQTAPVEASILLRRLKKLTPDQYRRIMEITEK